MPSYRSSRQTTMEAFLDADAAVPLPRVLNMRDYPQGIPDDCVYIGRGGRYGERWYGASRWHNDYRIGEHGTREEVIARWEQEARLRLADEPDWLEDLRGKRLVCHCAPLPCHGHALLAMLKERYGNDG